jgi:hypothetical protein
MSFLPQPQEKIGKTFKIVVIVLSVTLLVLSGFFVSAVFKRVTTNDKKTLTPEAELLTLAKQMEQAGLKDQAVEAYKQYLQSAPLPTSERSRIYLAIADGYTDINRCRDALFWLHRIEIADPDFAHKNSVPARIDRCNRTLFAPPADEPKR